MSEDKKNTSYSNGDAQKKAESVKNVQTAPVLKTHEVFSYNGDSKEKNN